MMIEEWRAVPGFEGAYEVSNLGRVRSLDRIMPVLQRLRSGEIRVLHKHVRGRTLRPGLASNGYYTVALGGWSHCIHDLVLTTFKGPRPSGYVSRHLDGDRTHSVIDNLEWGTRLENRADADRHGTSVRGQRYRTAKLTDTAVRKIRLLHYFVPQSELADRFNVSPAAIQAVHDKRTWKHVK